MSEYQKAHTQFSIDRAGETFRIGATETTQRCRFYPVNARALDFVVVAAAAAVVLVVVFFFGNENNLFLLRIQFIVCCGCE